MILKRCSCQKCEGVRMARMRGDLNVYKCDNCGDVFMEGENHSEDMSGYLSCEACSHSPCSDCKDGLVYSRDSDFFLYSFKCTCSLGSKYPESIPYFDPLLHKKIG